MANTSVVAVGCQLSQCQQLFSHTLKFVSCLSIAGYTMAQRDRNVSSDILKLCTHSVCVNPGTITSHQSFERLKVQMVGLQRRFCTDFDYLEKHIKQT